MPPGTAAAIAIISGLGCLVVGAGAQYVMMNIKMATETQREKERQQVRAGHHAVLLCRSPLLLV